MRKYKLIQKDGFEIKLKREHLNDVLEICKEWENITHLELEYLYYDKLIIKDVNNYIASYTEKDEQKVKQKGLFEYKNLPYNKNKSYSIIPKALELYFLKGIPVKKTIEEEKDIFLFCRGIKAKSNSWYELVSLDGFTLKEEKLQKVNRYFISKKGGKIIKRYQDGRQSFVEASKVTQKIMNIYDKNYDYIKDVNYSYYIIACNNLINEIKSKNRLF